MGQKFGRVHRLQLDVGSPADAVRALMAMVPGFRRYLIGSRDAGIAFTVFAASKNVAEAELRMPVRTDRDIRIAPIPRGKKGGIFQIILGAVLIVAGAYVQYLSGGTPTPLSTGLINAGIAMVVGGVIQLLTPTPRVKGSSDRGAAKANTSFTGPINTVSQGNPNPVFYGGPMKVGSMVASAGIRVKEADYTPTPTSGTTGFMGGGRVSGNFAYVARTA